MCQVVTVEKADGFYQLVESSLPARLLGPKCSDRRGGENAKNERNPYLGIAPPNRTVPPHRFLQKHSFHEPRYLCSPDGARRETLLERRRANYRGLTQ